MTRHPLFSLVFAVLLVIAGVLSVSAAEVRPDSVEVSDSLRAFSQYTMTAPILGHLPTRGYQDVVRLQPGVFIDKRTGATHVRGGWDGDAAFYVDGVSIRDDFSGRPVGVLSNNMLDRVSVHAGGIDARFGNATSGAVDIQTIEGGSELHGVAEAVTDNFHGERTDYNLYSIALNGPLLPNSDRLTFAGAVERLWHNDGQWNWHGKLRWQPASALTLRAGTLGSEADWRTYLHEYYFNREHMPRTTLKNYAGWSEAVFTPNEKLWCRLQGSWLSSERKTGDGFYFDDLWRYGRPGGQTRFDQTALFWLWDDSEIDAEGNQIITPSYDSVLTVPLGGFLEGDSIRQAFVFEFTRVDSVGQDEFGNEIEYTTRFMDESHVYDDFQAYKSSSVDFRFDLNYKTSAAHELRAGAGIRRHTVRYYRSYFPVNIYQGGDGGFRDIDNFGYDVLAHETDADDGLNGAKHPIDISAYLDDRIQIGHLTVNAGIRLDHFDYDAMRLRDPRNPFEPGAFNELDLVEAETHTRLSPRFGISYPVTRQANLHARVAVLHRRPDLQYLYSSFDYFLYKIKTGGYFSVLNSAALEPLRTNSYELGVDCQCLPNVRVGITGFYNDMTNRISIVQQGDGDSRGFKRYLMNENAGDSWSKGVEISLGLKRTNGIAAQLSYTLQDTYGKGDWTSVSGVNNAWQNTEPPPIQSGGLPHDQPHKFTGVVDVVTQENEGPQIGSAYPFDNMRFNVVVNMASGPVYSPTGRYAEVSLGVLSTIPEGPSNSEHGPIFARVDMKLSKLFPVGSAGFDLYFWVLNLFDRDNAIDVYSSTGLPDHTGYLQTEDGIEFIQNHNDVSDASGLTGEEKFRLRENDPNNFDVSRQLRFGVRFLF